jgi:hypothetical protein
MLLQEERKLVKPVEKNERLEEKQDKRAVKSAKRNGRTDAKSVVRKDRVKPVSTPRVAPFLPSFGSG